MGVEETNRSQVFCLSLHILPNGIKIWFWITLSLLLIVSLPSYTGLFVPIFTVQYA
ncbi:hypothetical protein M758_3G178700 [Ceratodon purpureus]|nr:hypothetical protein M758_3G178700 [Ceratodon purpureus]